MTAPSHLDRQLEELENKLERQHGHLQNNNSPQNAENQEIDRLMKAFTQNANVPTNDDVVCINPDCQDPKYAWLKGFVGLVVKIRQVGDRDPPEMEDPGVYPDFKYEDQKEPYCVVEFNLFHAIANNNNNNNNNTNDYQNETSSPSATKQQKHPPSSSSSKTTPKLFSASTMIGALSSPPGMDLTLNNYSNSGDEYGSNNGSETASGCASPRDPNNNTNNNNNPSSANSSLFTKVSIPSGVLHAAVPASILQIRDRGIAALDTVVHIPTARIGSVGGYRLLADVMPVEFPQNSATSQFVNDEKQREIFQRAGLLSLNPNPDAVTVSDNDEETHISNNNKNAFTSPYLHQHSLELVSSSSLKNNNNNQQKQQVPSSKVFKLHCTDLMPGNPYRRTVAVVNKQTLQVGFIDDCEMNAVVMLDNGSLCLIPDLEALEKDLTRPPKHIAKEIRAKNIQNLHNNNNNYAEDEEQGGGYGDEDENHIDADEARIRKMLKEFGVNYDQQQANKNNNKNKKGPFQGKKSSKNKKNKKNSETAQKYDEDDDDEEEHLDEEEDDDEIDAYFGENYTDAQISAARGHSDSNDGATMDDIGKEEVIGKINNKQHNTYNNNNKKNKHESNNETNKQKNHQKTTSSSSLTIDDDANPSSRQGSFALSEHLPRPSSSSHQQKSQTTHASIKDFNSENFAPFDDGENDEEEEEEEEDEEEQEHISVKWDMIDEQLLDDGIWPPPNVNFPSFVQNNYNNTNNNNNISSISSAHSTPTSIVEHNHTNSTNKPVPLQNTTTLFPTGASSATSAFPNVSSNNMDVFDETIGKVHGLPLWARTRPTLGWLRKCIVPHFMVKNKEIIMALGQPDYQKNKERGYDVGTIICLSCEKVYVKWTTPNFDPNNTEVPVSPIEECAPENLFIIQNFYHELLGVDYMHDVAFLRTPPKINVSENNSEENVDEKDNNNNNYDYSHGTIQDREIERERAKVEFEEKYLKFMLHDPDQIVLNPQDEEKRKLLLPYYNFEEVETSVTGLNAVELNKFYARFQFPESLEAAAKRMSGRNAIPNLLYDAKWAQFFKDLSEILCSAVRVVDIESQCCVTWANGERSHGVPARELVRPEAQPGSVFEHITALPRDLVHRPQDVVDFQATLALHHQQQQPQSHEKNPAQAVATHDEEGEGEKEKEKIKTSETEKADHHHHHHQQQQASTEQHFCFVHRKQPVKFETCAMFDVARCAYPDTDCVVSDVVTLRTKDEQAQVAALAGPPPREVGQVMSINPIEMTAEVAWRKFCDWEYLLDKTNVHNNNNHNNSNESTTHVHQPSPSFTIPLDSYPTISTAEARVETAANESCKKEDTFAKYFLESINAKKDNDANSSSPSSAPSPFFYNPSFMVGQVMGKLAFDQVIVKWWDGSFEILPIGRLVVHHFPYDDDAALEGEDDDFIDDEDGGDDDDNEEEGNYETEGNNNNLHVAGDNLVDIPSPMMPSSQILPSTSTTTNSQQQQQHVDPFEQDELNKNKNTTSNSIPTRGGVLGSFISTAAKSVGNMLFSAVMGKNAASDAVSFISSAMTNNTNKTNNNSGGATVGDEDKTNSSGLENASSSSNNNSNNNVDVENEETQDRSSSPSSLHPVSTTPGTFQACSRFVSHLIDSDTSLSFTPAQPTIFTRRLLNEIKSLRTTLMPDIFVKSNEDRSHTFKFAIAGAIHTPYYGGFYSFDMALPSNFPNSPPTLKFHARNMRLNPNLYEDGHVCLSLLGTWNGQDQCEQWSPSSTLRQVFLSVQAIILCQEPYYNEAGYDSIRGTPEGQAHSRLYNEHTFLLKISHLMHFAAQPPPDWVFEFREHYKKQVPRLLQRMRKYAENNNNNNGNNSNNNNNNEAGSVNADGLVAPLSAGLRHALPNRIDALQKQYDVLVTKWNKELEEYEAGFVGGQDDEDEDDKTNRKNETEDP